MMDIENNNSIAISTINNLISLVIETIHYSSRKEAQTKQTNGSIQYFTGSDYPLLNGVFADKNIGEDYQHHFTKMTEYFSSKKVPYIWWWAHQSNIPETVKQELDSQGFQFIGNYYGISIDLNDMQPVVHSDKITVKKVSTEEEYKTYLNVLSEVMQLSDSVTQDFAELFSSYGANGKFQHYLGYYDGTPASTLTTFTVDTTVGCYCGTTLSAFQKQGLCTAVATYALMEAKQQGCEYAVAQLMADAMAKGLTEKIGFKECCQMLPFLKMPSV